MSISRASGSACSAPAQTSSSAAATSASGAVPSSLLKYPTRNPPSRARHALCHRLDRSAAPVFATVGASVADSFGLLRRRQAHRDDDAARVVDVIALVDDAVTTGGASTSIVDDHGD